MLYQKTKKVKISFLFFVLLPLNSCHHESLHKQEAGCSFVSRAGRTLREGSLERAEVWTITMAAPTQLHLSSYLHTAQMLHEASSAETAQAQALSSLPWTTRKFSSLSCGGHLGWLTSLHLPTPLPFKGIPRQSTSFPFNKIGPEQGLRQPRLASHSGVRDNLKLQVLFPPPSVWCWPLNPGLHNCWQVLHQLNHSVQSLFWLFVWPPVLSMPLGKGEG